MIANPSCARMVGVVRSELGALSEKAEPSVQTTLAMIDSILNAVEVRVGHEIAWMFEEISAIEELADSIAGDAVKDPNGRVADGIAALRNGRHTSLFFDSVASEYDLASELLSRFLEASISSDGAARDTAVKILRSRVYREMQILGPFSLLGRS